MKNNIIRKTILILTWRDIINNPQAGGSEVYVDHLVNGLSKNYDIVVFSSKDVGQKSYENIDNVTYYRKGSRYTVYFWAFIYYLTALRSKIDFIIDVENGIPFFSPLYSKKPKVTLVHHFHNGQWFKEFPLPIAMVGYCIERYLMPFVYKKVPFVTVSNSSKLDLEQIGVNPKNIKIGYNGINISSNAKSKSASLYKKPTVLYLGRLKKYKQIDFAIKAVKQLKSKIPNVQLIIAGSGDDEYRLKKLVKQLKLTKNVKFLGFVDDQKKVDLLKKSWVFVNPSSKEGWGVVNIEANHFGTPVVGFNVYGVRDSVQHGYSGLLAETFDDFVGKLEHLLSDKKVLKSYSKNAIDWSKNFNWDDTVNVFEKEISKSLRKISIKNKVIVKIKTYFL